MDAPEPPAPRATRILTAASAVVGIGVVVLGLAIDEMVAIVGCVLVGFALVLFISTAGERARAALPVQRELAEIVASTVEHRQTNPFKGSQSTTIRVPFVELHFEDGTAASREVCDSSLRRKVLDKALAVPCMAVVYCRGDEIHGWRHVADG